MLSNLTIGVVIVQLSWYQVDITMSEGSNADNTMVDIEEKCIVNDKPERIETVKVAEFKDELQKRR